MKRCSKCGETKELSEFNKNKTKKDGLYSQCRTCWKEVNKASYQRHKEATLARQKKYQQQNAEARKEYKRQYDQQNAEAKKEYGRRHYQQNKKAIVERQKAYRHKNPDISKAIRQNRRARNKNAEGTHTALDIQRQYEVQSGLCYWCGVYVGDKFDVDHVIPLAKGGSNWPDNLVISCPSCNRSKGAKLPHEFVPKAASR